jgi:repressor LexA
LKELTDKQNDVLSFVIEYITAHGRPPTLREVADEFDISVGGAIGMLNALEKKNYIEKEPGSRRGIKLTRHRVNVEEI